jgi:hypothetical protein
MTTTSSGAVTALLIASAIGCKAKTEPVAGPLQGSGSAAAPGSAATPPVAPAPPPAPPPTWTLETAPVDVACGDVALVVTKPAVTKPAADRALARSPGIAACHGLPSVDAVCGCLAKAAGTWAANLLAPPALCVTATIDGLTDPHVAVVDVSTDPTDTATKVGGRAFVLVAQQGATWSAVDTIASVGDVDQAVTPKRSGSVNIDRLDVKPGSAGTIYITQSRSWTSEHAVGQTDADGSASVTICSVPSAPATPAFCYLPLSLGAWTFTHDDGSDKCTVPTADFFAATITATSARVRLVHGNDAQGESGRYRF